MSEAVRTVMCSWWWAGEPPETCRASVKLNKFKKRWILLAVIWNYITMHGHTNIKHLNTSYLLLLPLALQPDVGFGLSNNTSPSFPITNYLHLLTPNTWRSLSTSSLHPFLGLPLRLVLSRFWVKIFLGILSSSILSRWPSQLILCPFIHFIIFEYFI